MSAFARPFCLCGLLISAAVWPLSAAAPASGSDRLLKPAVEPAAPEWLIASAAPALRSRMAYFEVRLLEALSTAVATGGVHNTVTLDLFDDLQLQIRVEGVDTYGQGRFVIRGVVVEAGESTRGTALLSVADGVLEAELTTAAGRKFSIRHAGGLFCRISEIDVAAAVAECGSGGEVPAVRGLDARGAEIHPTGSGRHESENVAPESHIPAEAEPAVVDVMIVYTPAFLRAMGGVAAVEARCQMAISTANAMFANSAIQSRIRLAHVAPVQYVEDAEMSVDLARLTDTSDGYMDEVAALREQYSADVVHLFGSLPNARRGQATGYPSDYHAVVISGEAVLFTHELGHNFGCQHDRAAAGTGGSSFAFGHVFTGDNGRLYGCVMSYTGNAGATQITQFSNPDVRYRNTPTGVPKGRSDSANNARMVDLTAPIIARMREPGQPSSRMPVFANPPRLNFPVTNVGSTSPNQTSFLFFAGAGRQRPLQVNDFRLEGDAAAFIVEVWDGAARRYVTGSSFTLPATGLTLFVRFRPVSTALTQARIIFVVDDPAHRYSPPPIQLVGNATAPMFKNISTRVQIGAGDDVLIGGIIIGGETAREVLVRATGPSLADRGVMAAIADPSLELYRGSEIIAHSDDWTAGFPRESIRWTGLAPSRDLESAVLMKLEPGSYTAVVRGHGDATGVGLVEAYDLEPGNQAEFLNISTRGQVRPGDGVMIGGFILGGASPSRVLVRALGPSLASAGVNHALQNPALAIHDSQGTRLTSNDDWRSGDAGAIAATGLAPEDDREAAVLQTLPAGAYTAVVSGAAETTGIGLVEMYRLPAQ